MKQESRRRIALTVMLMTALLIDAWANAQLLGILEPSPEEQRLTDLYRKKGPKALADELNKF